MRSTTTRRLTACRSAHKDRQIHLTYQRQGDEIVGYDRNHRAREWRKASDGTLTFRMPTQAEREEMDRERDEWRKRRMPWPVALLLCMLLSAVIVSAFWSKP